MGVCGDLPPTWGVCSLNPTHPGADPPPQDEHHKASPLHSPPLPSMTPAPAGVVGLWLERALEQVPSLPGGHPNDTREADQAWGGVSGWGWCWQPWPSGGHTLRWTHDGLRRACRAHGPLPSCVFSRGALGRGRVRPPVPRTCQLIPISGGHRQIGVYIFFSW